jgi:hypothetical protein
MSEKPSITISLPESILTALQAAVAFQRLSCEELCRRIIAGMSNLLVADLQSLEELPRRERKFVDLEIELEWSYLDCLSEAARVSKLTNSHIFGKIFYALFFTHKLRLRKCKNGQSFLLEITQLHFEFEKDYAQEADSSVSRQDRDAFPLRPRANQCGNVEINQTRR